MENILQLPEWWMVVSSHWVYRIMHDGAGNVQQLKAQQVCGGNHQIEDIGYQPTFAPTLCLDHIRLAHMLATDYHLTIHPIDECTVFLGVDLEDMIYMHPQQVYFHMLQTGSRYNHSWFRMTLWKIVLLLRNSLSNLKRSLQIWYGAFKDFVMSIGFIV